MSRRFDAASVESRYIVRMRSTGHHFVAFSLIELMTVAAIAMVLTALALPSINNSILLSKRAEAATNVDGIDVAMVGYITTLGDPPPDPVGIAYPDPMSLGRGAQAWTPTTPEWPLGDTWSPSGDVRCGYHYELGMSDDLLLYGVCDVNDTNRFYVESRRLVVQSFDTTSQTLCCTGLYASCVVSTDCY